LLGNPCFAAGARLYSDLMDIALGDTIGLLCIALLVGIFLSTVAQSMPPLGLLMMLVYLPMNRSTWSPAAIRRLRACPLGARWCCTHRCQHISYRLRTILYRGAGIDVVWPKFRAISFVSDLSFSSQF
jgi:ABC-2 type transport system permease protein